MSEESALKIAQEFHYLGLKIASDPRTPHLGQFMSNGGELIWRAREFLSNLIPCIEDLANQYSEKQKAYMQRRRENRRSEDDIKRDQMCPVDLYLVELFKAVVGYDQAHDMKVGPIKEAAGYLPPSLEHDLTLPIGMEQETLRYSLACHALAQLCTVEYLLLPRDDFGTIIRPGRSRIVIARSSLVETKRTNVSTDELVLKFSSSALSARIKTKKFPAAVFFYKEQYFDVEQVRDWIENNPMHVRNPASLDKYSLPEDNRGCPVRC